MDEKVAIVGGTGDLGFALALRWAKAGVNVVIGSRDAAKAEEAAGRVREKSAPARITGAANADAAAQAKIVVLTVPFTAQAGTLNGIKKTFTSGILVDTTVPLAAAVGGRATRVLGVWEGSCAQAAQALLPGVRVISAFHNVSAELLHDLDAVPDCDVFLCGDDAEAKQKGTALVNLIPGLRALDAGGLEMSRICESMTALLISLNRRYKTRHSGFRVTGIK
ncbi:MAG TPA: NADPH-dependent F420 reductase [Micropepsaceae bacterium]|nr:NADPH-dependent F420 reductase [Micropepsaceae bacterium]